MATAVSSITRQATRNQNESLNILTFCTHERYETGLAKTGHNFYAWRTLDGSLKDWDEIYAPLPSNYTLLNPREGNNQLPSWLDFDLVLSQNKFGQHQLAYQIANQLQLPLISLEHTLPLPNWDFTQLQTLHQMRGHINVFISEFSRKAWGWGEQEAEVVHHGIDTDTFTPIVNTPKNKHLLSVVNDWINRNWCCGFTLWQAATKDLPVYPIGNTPGFSRPAKDVHELVDFYNQSQVFINTSLVSPIPTALLEAMSCGCAVVSTSTCMIPEIIQNGYNGYISNNPQELRRYAMMLLDNPAKCEELGRNARQTILDKFSMDKFVNKWNDLLHRTAKIQNLGELQ